MTWFSDQKIDRFIRERFPWGQTGYPAKPAESDPGSLRSHVERWLEEKTRLHGNAALALLARLLPILREAEKQLPHAEAPRLLFRIDQTALVKSPASILDKLVRGWDPEAGSVGTVDFRGSLAEMTDLGRFRIVVNFLSDIERVCSALEEPYAAPGAAVLSAAQEALGREFALEPNRLVDLVNQEPKDRTKGQRCRKGVLYPRSRPDLKVEVQVETMLQEAWDKKDHFLIYEPRRRGEPVHPQDNREMFAMSELLYVADLTFDRLRESIMARRKSKE